MYINDCCWLSRDSFVTFPMSDLINNMHLSVKDRICEISAIDSRYSYAASKTFRMIPWVILLKNVKP